MAQDKEFYIKIGGLKESINDFDKLKKSVDDSKNSFDTQNKTVGDYSKALREANKEIKTIQGEMLGLEKGSKAWTELAKKSGDYKDRIDDIREATRRYASDTKNLDDVINLAQSATAAFTLYKGAMSAFGVETENAEKALTELAGAMSIIQSLQTLSNTLKGSSATAELFNTVMKVTGAQLVQTQLASIKATAAQEGLSTAQKAGAVASKTLGLAMKAIPLMFIIGLVTELILHWEDLVGWFENTFPVLKKTGGLMNNLKGVVVGLGKAVLNWLINPFETFADVMKNLFAGKWEAAMKAAQDGIKNQFKGSVDAFKEGYQAQIEQGLDDIAKKAAAKQAEQTKYELDMLKARKGNQAKYSKEGIALQKKEFAERRKAAKGNAEEMKQIALDEANFTRECEEQKAAAAKKAASERAKANKAAAEAAKKAAQEAADAQKKAIESFKKKVQADLDFVDALNEETKTELTQIIKEIEVDLDKYASGPIEKYIDKLEEWKMATRNLEDANNRAFEESLWKEYIEKVDNLGVHFEDHFDFIKALSENYDRLEEDLSDRFGNMPEEWESWGLTEEQEEAMELILLKYENFVKKHDDFLKNLINDSNKKIAEAQKNELDDLTNDAERTYKWLMNRVKNMDVTPVTKDNIWGKLFGVIDEKETLSKYERIKKMWVRAYNEIQASIEKSETKWDEYLVQVETLYGKDSNQYKKAIQEKMDALENLRKKALEVGKVANAPTSLKGDYNADGTSDTPSGGTTSAGGSIQKGLGKFNEFFEKINDTVLGPAMDTFSMFMDFAIEETAQRLEQVQEMHDKALDKVNESADKIKELNEALKDSGNDNMDATKQQLADEQLLYAQRLAEERKLAEEEKNLKNKQAQQEANARKMELRYQLVMGIANTAQGASKALADWGWPLGAIFAGIMTALGLVQTALIAKQISQIKPVKYAEGGIINGKSHAQGGVPVGNTGIEVEGGEMVVSKKNTVKYIDVLTKINRDDPSVRYLRGGNMQYADTRIRKFANGGQLNFQAADDNLRANSDTNRLMGAINDIDMSPVVSVVDIWKAENRLTKVRGLAGRE